jgi:hypothetical protein
MSLEQAAKRARAEADVSVDPYVHAKACALAAALRAEEDRLLFSALIEPADPAPPKWSEVSRPGEVEYGPYCPRDDLDD